MNQKRTRIYVKANIEKNEIQYSGISFSEFVQYLTCPLENLVQLKGEYCGDSCICGFEVAEGTVSINKLSSECIYYWGEFCFVDCFDPLSILELSQQQIAELLYLAHAGQPLTSPFFECLHNRFVYLSHDDGWYGKLYCRNVNDFISVLSQKIASQLKNPPTIPNIIGTQLLQLAHSGIIIDLDDMCITCDEANLKIYTIGVDTDIDTILNNFEMLKSCAVCVYVLHSADGTWSLKSFEQ